MGHSVDEEIELLKQEIKRLSSDKRNSKGHLCVPYGVLFKDEHCQQVFEALLGTLKAAKKRKIIGFEGELLLQGVHDAVEISLLVE
jgi:hypothetical protein